MRSLTELVTALAAAGEHLRADPAWAGLMLRGITADSREVEHGMIFVALRGTKEDGARYIPVALENGAAAVLMAEDASLPEGGRPVCVLRAGDVRRAYALIAAQLYAPQPEIIVAVTGTDGKTSTADFARQLFSLSGKSAASLGTLGVRGTADDGRFPALHTTPDPALLHRTLNRLSREGVTHLAMEASSHGLDQRRLDGVRLKAAAFTNLSRDHLDYHGTPEAYFAAKRRLFDTLLPDSGTAVLFAGDPHSAELKNLALQRDQRVIDYGPGAEAIAVHRITPGPHGQRAEIVAFGVPFSFHTSLAGQFQVHNMLAATALAIGAGIAPEVLLPLLSMLHGVPGRLEKVAESVSGAAIYVDYAHTPGGLENVLSTMRPHCTGKLALVFGCGGDRDPGKRPVMGRIAAKGADRVYVTDDNPRHEDPAAIRRAVMEGCPDAHEIPGRAAAIAQAITELQPGDVLVIAGKGHEKTQIIGDTAHPFDDAAVARDTAGAR